MRVLTSLAFVAIASMQLSFTGTNQAAQTSPQALPAFKAPPLVFTVSQIIPVSIPVYIPCADGGTGEYVLLEGNLNDLFHVTINDNKAVFKYHDNPQGLTGTGETTGDKYQATGVTQGQTTIAANNGQYETTYVNNFRIIGQGTGNNYLVHETFHITFNAQGELTAEVSNFSVECQ